MSIVYRRSLKEMPADPIEIKDACEEGVDIQFLTAPLKVVLKDKVPTALRCQKMELGPPDESGRRRPVAVKGSDFDLACDHIISAIGQDCDVSSVTTDDDLRIETTKWRTICTNPRTGATNVPGIFSAGDVVSGPKAAIDAIGQARDVANVIDHYLKSGELIDIPWEFLSQKNKLDTLTPAQFEQFPKVARAHLRQNDPATRVKTYDEVDHALTENETKCESARCLSCGCSAVFTCDLKKVATDYRVDQKKYAGKVNKFRVDATHPHIVLDPNKCIVCGKCVRLCDEVLGIGALGYVRRGFEMVVKPALEKPLAETNCTSCGNCVEICPTGALSLKMPCTQPGPFKTTTYDSVCSLCGSNCALVYHKVNDDIWTVGGKPINQYTQGLICQRGRFGQHNALRTNRLTSARRTQQGKTAPCSMDEAINALAQGLLTTHKTQGPEAMGFLISPTATNEVTYLFQKLAREVFLSNQVSSLSDLTQDHIIPQLIDSLGMTGSALTPNDLDQTHVIVLMNSDITEDSPVLSYSVKQAVRNGAKLISLSSANFDINKQASLWLNTRKGSHATLLQTVCGELIRQNKHDINYLKANTIGWETFCQNQTLSIETAVQECGVTREQIRVLIDLLGNSEANIAFLFNPYSPSDGTPDDLGIIINYLMLTGRSSKASNGLMLVHEHGNRQGHINYGGYVEVYAHNAHVAKQNGLQGVKTSSELRDKLLSNQIKSLFVWDEDVASEPELAAIFKNTPFTATVTPHDSPTAKMAKLVLPGTLPAESEGTLTDQYRCQRPFTRVFAPPSGLTGFEILSRVYAQTANREVPTLTQIREEMALFVKGLMRPEKMKFVLLES
ncbi:MAG: hypothetical protein ACD_62C00260G0005 [uncultured bacterium]|nr:MAG: hypothetical protein ACD_62C00260G0005 [uncultured bacterium]